MELKKQNILFFTRTMGLGGTENVILQLCEIFKPLVNKIVVCSCGGVNVTEVQKSGINHYEITDIDVISNRWVNRFYNRYAKRISEWIDRIGLEWFYRLCQNLK